jgi:hypothetical protein
MSDAATEETEPEGTEPEETKEAEGPVVVSEVDRLRAENINLRLLNAVNRETLAQKAAQDAGRARAEANQATLAIRTELEKKYGVNLQTHQIDENTGEVRPRQGQLPPQLQAMMGGRG